MGSQLSESTSRDSELADIRRRAGGKYEASLLVFEKGEVPDLPAPVAEYVTPDEGGYSLAEMRQRLGGDSGHIRGPDGNMHFVSLEQWRESDPQITRVIVRFRFVPGDDDLYAELIRDFARRHGSPPSDE
jgi:hypothetical protein